MNVPRIPRSPRCRIARSSLTAAVLAALLMHSAVTPSAAQTSKDMAAMPGMSDTEPVPPPEQLPVPIKMTGIGNSHIAIKASPEAQAWFDQGLSLLHDFWDYESSKAFEQSIRVDPDCAMCYWGLAQAEGMRGRETEAYAKKALARAVALKSHANSEGKLYIQASAEADAATGDARDTAGISTLRTLVKKNPHDIEARIFLSNAVRDGYDDKGDPKPGMKEGIAILEGVLREAPNDSAANHYWIHAMEPGNHPENAIPSAALLASLAPTSGHMVHMPGHIYYRVGDYKDAERWFAASMNADETYMRDQHVTPDDDWNYVHNMMYAIANLIEQGKLADADTLSDHLSAARGKLSATLYVWSARDQMARISRRLPVALRTGDWDAVLAMLSQSSLGDGEKTANLRFLSAELSDYARGMKALDAGDAAAAQEASESMDAGLWRGERDQADKDATKKDESKNDAAAKDASAKKEPAKDEPVTVPIMPDAEAGPLMKALSVASLELRGGVLVAQGKLDQGKKLFASARTAEKKLGYHEPPFYIRPVGENEAVALIRAKDYAGAKAAYEAALVERPNSGFDLYGLAHVAELQGDQLAARAGYSAFLKAWPTADSTLPEVVHARSMTIPTTTAGQ